MALPRLIAPGTSIAKYIGLLLGWHTILHGTTNNSLRVNTSITGYAGLLLGGCTILYGITNNSLRVDTRITGYAGLLLCRRMILSGIDNSSLRDCCFRNLYRWVRRVTAWGAYYFVLHS